jgi:hypothetical protein
MTPEDIDAVASAVAKKVVMEIGAFMCAIAVVVVLALALDYVLSGHVN